MAGTPADTEIVNENNTSHINHTNTIYYINTINYIITILNPSQLHQFNKDWSIKLIDRVKCIRDQQRFYLLFKTSKIF
jgi:hypothetical protein